MRVESGPTGERKIRTLLLFLMMAVFAVYFAYDGWWGYPKQNKEEHLEQLSSEQRAAAKGARVYETVTKESMADVSEALNKFDTATKREALEEVFGGPPSYENSEAWYYFGPVCWIKIPLRGGRPGKPLVQSAGKSETDIFWQKLLAVLLGVASLYVAWRLVHVVRTRLILDESGLVYRGKGPIPWDDLKGLDSERFTKKGWVDLVYTAGGAEQKVRLDEYHLAKFDEVIDEICKRKGFENPLPVKDGKPEVTGGPETAEGREPDGTSRGNVSVRDESR
ncbi:MAG: hypothetical protein JXQ75_10925 [Phycisphaerae bacterium]|nr:hypothetical protein [Phycisphaerae bacterium]